MTPSLSSRSQADSHSHVRRALTKGRDPGNLGTVFRRRTGVRVRQRIRKFELWPVFKLAVAFHAICGAISLGVLTLFWQIGENAGFTDRVINFLVDIGFAESVRISGASLFRGASTIVVGLVLHNTVVTVLLAALYNLLSGLLGGVIMSVVEDDQIRPIGRRRTSAVRRQIRRRATFSAVPATSTTPVAPTVPLKSREKRKPRNKAEVVAPTPSVSTPTAPVDTDGSSIDEFDDADWLAALADDSFDDDLDIRVETRAQARPSGGDATGFDASGREAR